MELYDAVHKLRTVDKMTWKEVGEALGRDYKSLRTEYREFRKSKLAEVLEEEDEQAIFDDVTSDMDAAKVFFADKKTAEDVDWRELITHAQAGQCINERMSDEQRLAEVRINTDKPVGIIFSGDWHLGDGATDHQSWRSDMEFLLDTPELYMIDLGDEIQNMRSFKTLSSVLNQVLSPQQQAQLMKSVVDELTGKHKLLAKVAGNHDADFDERIFGQALQKYLLVNMEAPKFNNRGLIKLTVGDEQYTILVFHKSRFSSFMRTTHANYREYQLSFPADIVAGAHEHNPGYEVLNQYALARDAGMGFGGETILIKCGSYQDNDYAWKYFHNGGQLNPTVVLFPHFHKKIVFSDPQDAVQYIQSLDRRQK